MPGGSTRQPGPFDASVALISHELHKQTHRVLEICETAIEAFFSGDAAAGRRTEAQDDEIDRADVAIEQKSVALLCAAARQANEIAPEQIRELLVIVKANNELERIADCAVAIGDHAAKRGPEPVPPTFRVMANSVLGILRDVGKALEHRDADAAKLALRSENTVRGFKAAVLRDAEQRIAAGTMTVDTGFLLHSVASSCEHIADHATNIAEQVLYAVTGTIVRHCEAGWVEVNL
jgi:phosphate transport system protein